MAYFDQCCFWCIECFGPVHVLAGLSAGDFRMELDCSEFGDGFRMGDCLLHGGVLAAAIVRLAVGESQSISMIICCSAVLSVSFCCGSRG